MLGGIDKVQHNYRICCSAYILVKYIVKKYNYYMIIQFNIVIMFLYRVLYIILFYCYRVEF